MQITAKLASKLKSCNSVCVLTGAGISAESGVPTFRGPEGLWSKFKPEELANVQAFLANPALVWEWYRYRKTLLKNVSPNPAHIALVKMEKHFKDFTLVTQNVDNLHARAGSHKVLCLHGNIDKNYCMTCAKDFNDANLAQTTVPKCDCGGLVRPGVVWFGESLPTQTFEEAESAARRSQLFLCIGTSAVVYPAASLPLIAKECGSYVVEINPEVTELSAIADESIFEKAGVALPQLVDIIPKN
ncbi:MAG: NAD-dependent deacylase [Deltaproteobacteria bacterium]|nr:NAD-dependent deacylase [Deltaproteobacteria bacterium]